MNQEYLKTCLSIAESYLQQYASKELHGKADEALREIEANRSEFHRRQAEGELKDPVQKWQEFWDFKKEEILNELGRLQVAILFGNTEEIAKETILNIKNSLENNAAA